ncbi:peptidase M48-like protein [Kineococcus xinjiangensis]|uniref:Peptidase M48-like protein n=1 Tax=Kineococcus xinjiangensis TaxID=512762 RepID=A0A2S6ITL8_9ACTN|nr:M56 family metallopeptidase [Kineococcus xinjiangensis]PPK97396.1 peptidase M48-like protein [Kineococcus xinjiangensis]
MTALLLGALGLALSRFVPPALARARWTSREPRAAIVLWQAVTLASVLSAIGVVLAAPEEYVRARGAGPLGAEWILLGALAVAGFIVARLLAALVAVTGGSRRRRARHRMLVDLLDRAEQHGDVEGHLPAGSLRVLDGEVPFAYCLPGRSPRVVVSGGALRALTREELAAVLDHEHAHLRARHDLVLEAFAAVHRAVPRPLRSRTALDAVHLLLEMAADDAARRHHGDQPLRGALATMGGAVAAPPEAAGTGRDAERERLRRLDRLSPGAPRPSRAAGAAMCALAAAVLLLPTVALVLPWLLQARAGWPL